MKKVSIFVHFANSKEHLPLEEIFRRIKEGIYYHKIKPLRDMLKAGNQKAYDEAKRWLIAFTAAGLFEGERLKEFISGYTNIIVQDIDKLSDEELQRVMEIVKQCDYTYACFISPSGNGLKVFVHVSTGPEEHLNAFLSVQQFYQSLTGVKIDPSGKDITRLCFVSADSKLYYNPDSTIFVPLTGAGHKWPIAKPKKPVGKRAVNSEVPKSEVPLVLAEQAGDGMVPAPVKIATTGFPSGIIETYRYCIAQVERFCRFVEGCRNEFVYALACKLNKAEFPEALTVMMLMHDYNFGEREVRSCIKSAYRSIRPTPEQGEGALSQDVDLAEFPDPASMKPPPPPSRVKKNKSRLQYDLQTTEELLTQWYEMHYNEVISLIEWRPAKNRKPFKRLNDYDENSMFRNLHHAGQIVPLNTLHAILTSNYCRVFNPFISYFKKLVRWDGITDYIGQLCKTVKTSDDAYWEICFRKWFVAYAASLVNDKVINHTVIVLVGAQGVGKTTWMKRLAPEEFNDYVGTSAMQSDSKDTAIMLSECALILLDEMESLNRKDLASFKELVTRPEIHVRKPYGRNFESMPHRASFIAGVNIMQVLTDPTGSRRYLCTIVESIDFKHDVDINCCLAQAYALYLSGFQFWFDQDEINELTHRNEDFMSKSLEEELIETWMRPVTREEFETRHQFANSQNTLLMNASQIAIKLMEKAKLMINDASLVKIGKVMSKLKYLRIRKKNNFFYLVRLVESELVDRETRTLDETEIQKAEQELNEQYIRFEEDLFNNNPLPF